MKAFAAQAARHNIHPGVAQVFIVLVLVMPSLFAFLASPAFRNSGATVPGLWFFYELSLNIGYGAIPVAVGLTALAVFDRESSVRSRLAMAAISLAGMILTWCAGQLH